MAPHEPFHRNLPLTRLVFLDLGEQPGLTRGACGLARGVIVDETARLEDNGAVRPIRPSSRKARGGDQKGQYRREAKAGPPSP
jgi:hypothetical protein